MNDDIELPEVLYHYTSNRAFLSILKSRELRLSALSQSNDALEGKWLFHALRKESREHGIHQDRRQEILNCAEHVCNWAMAYGFCLSTNGDQLSQWRGYADDGRGVAIGFNTEELIKMTEISSSVPGRRKTELKKVIYDEADHRSYVAPLAKKLAELTNSIQDNEAIRLDLESLSDKRRSFNRQLSASIRTAILGTVGSIFQLKSAAFKEEREWRILREIEGTENSEIVRNDEGLAFYASGSRIIPHHVLKFPELSDKLISWVVLGPKNDTPWSIIDMACCSAGAPTQGIRKSLASYR